MGLQGYHSFKKIKWRVCVLDWVWAQSDLFHINNFFFSPTKNKISFHCKLKLVVALVKAEGKKFGNKRIFTQNHRIVEVGRDLWMSSSPNPLLKQGHLE